MSALFWLFVSATQPQSCVSDPYGTGPGQKKPFVCSRASKPSTAASATPAQKVGGPSLNWPSKTASFRINQNGTRDIDGTQELTVLRQGFRTWTLVSGADFVFKDEGLTTSDRVGFDFLNIDGNQNVVIFQTDWAHDSQIIGLTTTTFNSQSGEIFDADIELNDEYYDFTIGDTEVKTDLLNTVTHETGHFLGFDHTDEDGSTIDPTCASTATMSRSSSPGETSKRVLAPSDELGMRFVYGAGQPIGFCFAPTETSGPAPTIKQVGGSLQAGCAQSVSVSAWWLFAALVLWKRRCSR